LPAGRCSPTPFTPPIAWGVIARLSINEPLLVGMREVTRGEWRQYLSAQPGADALDRTALDTFRGWPQSTLDWPASFMTLAEASAFAAARGMRLLSSAEWMVTAIGPRVLEVPLYPWGEAPQEAVANTLDLNLIPPRPTPVGTFEAGRTPQSCYDLIGNVREWTSDELLGRSEEQVSVLGGSYLTWSKPLYREGEFFQQVVARDGRFEDVGFRCAVSARAWLSARSDELAQGERARERLVAVGRRWGPAARDLLTRLASEHSGSEGLRWLLEGAAR
jgi:formylglycine-generating enzyme required for sulfatase activity